MYIIEGEILSILRDSRQFGNPVPLNNLSKAVCVHLNKFFLCTKDQGKKEQWLRNASHSSKKYEIQSHNIRLHA